MHRETFAYKRVPFGLINVVATFQRDMNVVFNDIIGTITWVYLDYLIIYSKIVNKHIDHLHEIFTRCKRYDIYYNPNKSIFGAIKGKLLGHIIYKKWYLY